MGYFENIRDTRVSFVLQTTELQSVLYYVEAPGVRYYNNGTLTADNAAVVDLNDSVIVSSHLEQDRGVHLSVGSESVTLIGQIISSSFPSSDTFLALKVTNFCAIDLEYIYYGMSVEQGTVSLFSSIVLIVGTVNNTVMKITVPQSVSISMGNVTIELNPSREYSFVINKLQTVLIESLDDLTGTKITTDKQISVFSGHQGGSVPNNLQIGSIDYLVEQIPSAAFWGNKHYIVPLATRQSHTIKILAAYNFTNVTIHCNDTVASFILHEAEFITKILSNQNYCAIHSTNSVLVAQLSHGQSDGSGDPMMTLVPATVQYLNQLDFSTISSSEDYNHYVNIIVLAEYYQPSMIYLRTGGVNTSLNSQEWVPIVVNNITEAYAAQVAISRGGAHITHFNSTALLTAIVHGFTDATGYGHPGGLNQIYKGTYAATLFIRPCG